MFKSKNRYPTLFVISFVLFIVFGVVVGIYLYIHHLVEFTTSFHLPLATVAFMIAGALAVPNVWVALFWQDDKIWEDRLVQLVYAERLAELRSEDLSITLDYDLNTINFDKDFLRQTVGSERGGKFVRWRVFNDIMKKRITDILIYKCNTNASYDHAKKHLRNARSDIRSLYRINNDWFFNTTLFMMFWSFFSAALLFGSFFWLTKNYQNVFTYWYEFNSPRGYVNNLDYFYYTLNATVKGFIANLFEIFSQNPPFFVREPMADVRFLTAKSTLIEIYEYIFRTLMALSLIPIAVAMMRMIRMWRLPRKIKRRIGVETQL